MSFDLKEHCPKCLRPECRGDCGLYTSAEKEAFIKERYLNDSVNGNGQLKVQRIKLAKNPLPPLNLGGYRQKKKKKK